MGLGLGVGLALGAGLAPGVGLALGVGLSLGVGLALGVGLSLGVGLGVGLGNGLSLGVGIGAGLSLGVGLGAVVGLGTVVGFTVVFTVEGLTFPRRVLPRAGVRGVVVSAGVGPASAGLVTSVPVAAGTGCGERVLLRLLATVRDGMNEHVFVEPATGISVRRSPVLRARSETTRGAVAGMPAAVGVPVSPA